MPILYGLQPVPTPRGVSRASIGAGRAAVVSGAGRNAPGLRRPKPCVPGELFPLVTCGPQGLALSRGQRCEGLERVQPAVDRGASPKSRPGISTGVHAEQATNTACGTPGSLTGARGKASMCFPLSHMDRGDRQSPASRASLASNGAHRLMPRAESRREND